MHDDHRGRVAYCSAVLCLVALAVSAMGQASVVWDPLYANPSYDRIEWTLTVHELSEKRAYYYWAFQDAFVGGGIFYFGLQPYGNCPTRRGNCKIALFSFFGNGAISTSPHCMPGADNGPGMSCHLAYDWRMDVPYRFAIQLSATDPLRKTETWTGTVTDTQSGTVSEIGNWTFPGQKSEEPGLIHGQPVSFVEYWIQPKGGCSSQPYANVIMSVPTGYREKKAYPGGIHGTSVGKACESVVRFTPYQHPNQQGGLEIETGFKKDSR